jgi:hypothetical protein
MTEHDQVYAAAKQAENFDLLETAVEQAKQFDCRLENFEINNFGQITRAYFQRVWERTEGGK